MLFKTLSNADAVETDVTTHMLLDVQFTQTSATQLAKLHSPAQPCTALTSSLKCFPISQENFFYTLSLVQLLDVCEVRSAHVCSAIHFAEGILELMHCNKEELHRT